MYSTPPEAEPSSKSASREAERALMSGPVSLPAKANILVVDDEESIRAFVVDALAEAGHRVAQASDGEAALALLAANSFDVVLTDLKMPRIDGSALLRQIIPRPR